MRIPGLISLFRISDPKDAAEVLTSEAADRTFKNGDGLFSRWIAERTAATLKINRKRFPSVAPRDDPERQKRQAELAETFANLEPDTGLVDDAAAYLLGRRRPNDMAMRLQAGIGQVFEPGFFGGSEAWTDSQAINQAPREFNPLKLFRASWTGSVDNALKRLGKKVGNDPAAMHGVSVAVHSFCASLTELRDLAQTPGTLHSLSPEDAVRQALCPPETVLRQATGDIRLGDQTVPKGALCAVNLKDAYLNALDSQDPMADKLAFAEMGWSFCPAAPWVRKLMERAWKKAQDQAKKEVKMEVEAVQDTPRFKAHMQSNEVAAVKLFRNLLAVRVAIDAILGLLALIAAGWLGNKVFSEITPEPAMIRLWGVMLLWVALLHVPSILNPANFRWPIFAGMAGRFALLVGYFSMGAIWLGWLELVFLLVLGVTYYRLFVAALQNNP